MANSYKFFPKKPKKGAKPGDKNPNQNLECSSFVIKRVTGKDEDLATQYAEAKGKPGLFVEELIKISVTEYNDAPVPPMWPDFDQLDSATRSAISKAFSKVNSIEDVDFLDDPVPME